MPLITTNTGTVYFMLPGGTSLLSLSVPSTVFANNTIRPVFLKYKKRSYIVGQFSRPLVWTEDHGLHEVGIQAPANAPVMTATTGTVTGNAIGYLTFRHKLPNGTIVHESNGSLSSSTVALTSQGRAWSSITTTSPNARVNFVCGYVSVDGALPRFAWERPLGVTTVTENVQTAALGQVMPTENGVPPYTLYADCFHDRTWYTGDPSFPDRVYYTELGNPEAVGLLSYMSTLDGEPVTGVAHLRDQLVLFCRHSIYVVEGYTEDDFNLHRVSPSVGCISNSAIVNIHNRLWFPSEAGVYVFDGAVMFAMKAMRDYWTTDYAANKPAYEDAVAVDSRLYQEYRLLIPKSTAPKTFQYRANYSRFEPSAAGEGSGSDQPDWTFTIRTRQETTMGILPAANSGFDEVYTGSCDGYIRKEDVLSNADDDGDTYLKKFVVKTGHFLFNDPGGGRHHGKSLTDLDVYLESESNAWTPKLWGGDEDASTATTPMFTATVAASASAGYAKKAVHHFRPTKTSGRGFTVEITATSPVGMEYRGLSGAWKPGHATRPAKA